MNTSADQSEIQNPQSAIKMRRCFELAELGAGAVSPNPMVGAVLVFEGKIIGEGWHQKWGGAHAEVNCLNSVAIENQRLISKSTLFCNLEPCFHFGKTPPCVELVLAQKIPHVVISNLDPNPKVAGQSIEKMRQAGIEVETGLLEKEGRFLNRFFFTWIEKNRPFILLKWAESADGFIGRRGERVAISGPISQRLSHKWRSEVDAILVGTTTALTDNPSLTNRYYFGKNPLRVAIDLDEKLSPTARIFDGEAETFTWKTGSNSLIFNLLEKLKELNKAILLVEGGANLLGQFIESGLWDEARIFKSPNSLGGGIEAPILKNGQLFSSEKMGPDELQTFFPEGRF